MNAQQYVFIVDDDDAVRDGLALVIETVGLACQSFVDAEDFLDRYVPGTRGCLVLDINMPGMNGDELQAELIRRHIRVPVIFLTAFGDIPTSVRTIKAGAVDFLTKPVKIQQLLGRIQETLRHETALQQKEMETMGFRHRMDGLTPREKEILPFAIQGLPNKEIAQFLGISYRTVEIHRTQILRKTGAANFLDLARLCEANHIFFDQKRDNP